MFPQNTRSIYQHILELRIATPQVVLNYASLLEEKHFFEEAFTVYERGLALFRWPIVYEIWNAYLVKFIKRFVRGHLFFFFFWLPRLTMFAVLPCLLAGRAEGGAHARAV